MKDIRQNIGKNIVRLRNAAHMTQAEFAEQLNYTDKAVSKWERGESVPDIVILKKIADQFSVTVDYLLEEHRPEEAVKTSEEIANKKRNHLIITLMAPPFPAKICGSRFWLPCLFLLWLRLYSTRFGARGNGTILLSPF